MSDVVGRGVIELSGDASKLNAAISEARRSINSLGEANRDATARASKSIDNYISKLQLQNNLHGRGAREVELYKLALRGATDQQLRAADAALRLAEAQKAGDASTERWRAGMAKLGAIAGTALIAAAVAIDHLIKKAGDFQDMAEKTGDTASNIASLAVAAGTAGTEMDAVVGAAVKLSKNLVGVDDDSKAAGAALKALGLNIADIKKMEAGDRIETIAKALNGFAESAAKGDVAMALFGKTGADLLPFLKELGQEGGRQRILTDDQIQAADDYADASAKLTTKLTLQAEAIAVQVLPAINDFKSVLSDIAKDTEFAATAVSVLKGAIQLGTLVFQTFALVGSDVAFTFVAVGREIGAVAAQMNALAHLDFKGFKAISEAVTADGVRARAELDRFQAKILSIGEPKVGEDGKPAAPAPKTPDDRPKLKFNGDSLQDREKAKARLERDLAAIKASGDSIANAYSNAEKILEARRAAGLVNERDYYDAKLGFIRINAAAEESELSAEIARMEREKLVGKDRIENDRKIADTKAKLAKVQANLAANVEVQTIQDAAAVEKLARAYADASIAAQQYLDTIAKQNQREIEGAGKGSKFRERQAGLDAITDRFTQAKQALDKDLRNKTIDVTQFTQYLDVARNTYAEETRLYEERTKRIEALQQDATLGLTEALHNYADEARDIASMTQDVVSNGLHGLEDALVDVVKTGKLSFKDLFASIAADIARIGFKSLIGKASDALLSALPAAAPVAGAVASAAGAAGNAASVASATALSTAETAAAASISAAAATTSASLGIVGATSEAAAAAQTAAATAIAAASLSSELALGTLAGAAAAAAAAMAAVAATSGAKAGTDAAGLIGSIAGAAGGRAIGGPVGAGGLYRVNETGAPEVLDVAGKQYLMMGNQSGSVIAAPTGGGDGGKTVILNVHVTPPAGASRATALQFGATAGKEMQAALRRNG